MALLATLPAAGSSAWHGALADWRRAAASAASADLAMPAARLRDAALRMLDGGTAPAEAYLRVMLADDPVTVEMARRRRLFASAPGGADLQVAIGDLAHHVTLHPFQRITDYRDDRLRVEVPGYPEIDSTRALTYSLWAQLDADITLHETKVLSHAGVDGGKLALMLTRGNRVQIAAHLHGGGGYSVEWKHRLPAMRWVHLGLTFSLRDGFRLFVDGEEMKRSVVTYGERPPGVRLSRVPEQTLYIGSLDRAFPGLLDDVRIYDRALPPDEVAALASGKAVNAGLVGHWPLDEAAGRSADNLAPGPPGRIGIEVIAGEPGAPALPGSRAFRFGRAEEFWPATLDTLQERVAAVERRLLQEANEAPRSAVDLKRIVTELRRRDAVLIHYVEDTAADRLVAFRVEPGAAPPVRLFELGSASEIAEQAVQLERELRREDRLYAEDEHRYRRMARELTRRIWDPVSTDLPADGAVLLRLGESLRRLPFAALVDRGGHYLVAATTFGRIGPVVGLTRNREDRGHRAELFGNPAFNAFPGFDATPPWKRPAAGSRVNRGPGTSSCLAYGRLLYGSEQELKMLSSLLRDAGMEVRVHEWQEAHKSALRRAAPGAGVLHIATHSYSLSAECLPRLPADPATMTGLQLSGVNRPQPEDARQQDDGLLSALEFSQLALDGAELVVFSGCGTARGPALPGAERFGLTTAAWIAGAGASLGTLWNVDDATMPIDLTVFYRSWLEHRSPVRALSSSLSAALQRTERERGHAHPALWAALVVDGL